MAEDVEDGRTTRWCYIDGYVLPPGEYVNEREVCEVPIRSRQDCEDLIALLERVKERLPK